MVRPQFGIMSNARGEVMRRVHRVLLGGVAIWSLGTAAPDSAHAADWWVDAGAGPAGDGSMGSPFLEIQEGLAAAMPGDTVHVLPGVYGAIVSVRHAQPGARITIVAEEPRAAVIEADGTALRLEHDHHTFEGIVFDSGYGPGDGIRGGGDDVEFLDVEVRRTTGDCIDLRNTTGALIDNASLHHCIAVFNPDNNPDAHGVTGDSVFDLTIRNSEIYLLTGDAVQLSPSRQPWDNLRVENTLMWSGPLDEAANGWAVGQPIGENAFDSKVGATGNGGGDNPRVEFVNVIAHGWRDVITNQGAFNVKEDVDFFLDRATIYDCEYAFRLRAPAVAHVQNTVLWDVDRAFRLEGGLTGLQAFNVTVGGDIALGAIQEAGGASQDTVFRNALFLADELPPLAQGPSNLAVDGGVFVDVASHDYHLVMGASPVDAGETIAQVDVDRDGVSRPVGDAYDVGAFEWTDEPPPGTDESDESGADGDGDSASGSASDGQNTEGGSPGDNGVSTDATEGEDTAGAGEANDGGCGCATSEPPSPWSLWLLAVGAMARRRRSTEPQ
jgi:MYXO-CTERM domain-containing protein